MLTDWADTAGVTAIALQEHKRDLSADLSTDKFTPLLTPAPEGPGGGLAGGVGWAVRTSALNRVRSQGGPGEGPEVAWLTLTLGLQEVHLASAYVPPGKHDAVAAPLMTRLSAWRGDLPWMVLGDINCDLSDEHDSDAEPWRMLAALQRWEFVDLTGPLGGLPTRFPLGAQRGAPRHLDSAVANSALMSAAAPQLTQLGTGGAYDTPGQAPMTDHKVLVVDLDAAGPPAPVRRPPVKRYRIREAMATVHKERDYAATLAQRGALRRAVQRHQRGEIDTAQLEAELSAELVAVADDVVGFQYVPAHVRPKATGKAVTTALKAYKRAHVAARRLPASASGEVLAAAKRRRAAAKRELKAQVRRRNAEEVQQLLDAARARGPEAVTKVAHHQMRRIAHRQAGACGRGEYATMSVGGGQRVARGADQVGRLVSDYTYDISRSAPPSAGFDDAFKRRAEAALAAARESPDWGADASQQDAPTREEVRTALASLRSKLHKAPGKDGVTNWMLVWGGEALLGPLTYLYEAVWLDQTVPEAWSTAEISYIYKGKGAATEVSNYRPISLISCVGKAYTRAWLPRLTEKVCPHLVTEQGCSRKRQGALEQLWAVTSVIEDAMDAGTGAYALFADVHKAYDQVWRDGLYLSLYAHGVRGRLWGAIQAWMRGATATTRWQGARGPEVRLEEGLRQGCVLSPILYCVFINMFMAEHPVEDSPPGVEAFMGEFFSQGLQALAGGRSFAGLPCRGLPSGPKLQAAIFMDDTTLVAQTRSDLAALISCYHSFCRRFRMRINAGKSKLMRFTRGDVSAGQDRLAMEVEGVTYSTPDARPGAPVCHKFLGYTLDSGLTGAHHARRQLGMAQARCRGLELIAKTMGEEFALWYLRTTVAPAALYAMEMVQQASAASNACRVHTLLIAEAVRLGRCGGNPGRLSETGLDIPSLRRDGLLSETDAPPWDVEVSRRAVRLMGSVRMAAQSRSHSLAACVWRTGGGMRVRGPAEATVRAWGVPTHPAGCSKRAKERWGAAVRQAAGRVARQRLLALQADRAAQLPEASDAAYVAAMSPSGGDAARWRAYVPNAHVRQVVRSYKLGAMPLVATNFVKRGSAAFVAAWRSLTPGQREEVVRCPCGAGGRQDVPHVLFRCGFTRPAREAAVEAMDRVMARPGLSAEALAWWGRKAAADRFRYMLSSARDSGEPPEVLRALRAGGCAEWVRGLRGGFEQLVQGACQIPQRVYDMARRADGAVAGGPGVP